MNPAFLTWLNQLWTENLLDHSGFVTMDSLRQITDGNAAIPYGVLLSSSPLTVVPSSALNQYSVLEPLTWNGKQAYRDLLGPVTRGTFALTRACREPEKMVAWVNTLYTREGSLLLQVGQEGEEYFWTEDGTWDWMADMETVAKEVLPNSTLSDGGVAPGIIELDFQSRYTDPATVRMIREMAAVREKCSMPYPLVFLSAEDAARAAALQAGDVPLTDENWESFVRGLEERGLDEMTAIWQKYVK